jgi:hypothetical protein
MECTFKNELLINTARRKRGVLKFLQEYNTNMHFIITTNKFTLTANFTPCLVWKTGDMGDGISQIWNPHRENPNYQKGDLQKALLHFKLDNFIVHTVRLQLMPGQAGSKNDAKILRSDMTKEFDGFELYNRC